MGLLLAPFAVLLGVVLTVQVATNAQLGKALGNPYIPATVNMVIGFFATVVLAWSLTSEWPSRELLRAAPWYAWFTGGIMGVIYLTGTILLAPRLGAGALVGLVVAGQLMFSVLLDHFGWIGFEQHSASVPRLLGCALMIGGVFLIWKF
jgi:transporter family-2 protein